jgi:hypothetical protein
MANNSISLVALDFDGIKSNLKSYLQAQPQFADYNFNGSNISVLLDILSYNTHLNAFYLNMVASEMFLDSAQLRNSVVSKAKELNYTPKSIKSAQATLNMSFPQSGLSTFSIPVGTKFTGKNANGSYTFLSTTSTVLYPSGGAFAANNFVISEGVNTSDSFIINNSVEGQRFVLSSKNIDTSSVTVTVIENNGQTNTIYTKADNLYGLNATSTVYFLQGAEDNKYEVVFGDGVFGKTPLNGSLVFIVYRSCYGTDANGTTNFNLDTNLGTYNGFNSVIDPTITVVSTGNGGANAESIESIRFNAPRHYQTQDRAITQNDFKAMILQEFNDIKAVHVFGGETVNNSVQFGKVFISPISYSGYTLSNTEKSEIEVFLSNKCTLGIKPKVIDPDFLYLILNTTVKYDPNSTAYSAYDIQNIVSNAITTYNSNYLIDFNIEFKLSRLEAAINDADPSISSNETTVVMRKDVSLQLNTDTYIDVNFHNPIIPGSLYTTEFISDGNVYAYTDYNPNNNTFTIQQNTNGAVTINNSSNIVYLKNVTTPGYESYIPAGIIDYASGSIQLAKISISGFVTETSLKFYATPTNQNIYAKENDLMEIDAAEGINITVKSI